MQPYQPFYPNAPTAPMQAPPTFAPYRPYQPRPVFPRPRPFPADIPKPSSFTLFDNPSNPIFTGVQGVGDPTLPTPSTDYTLGGGVSWLDRLENQFCKISVGEALRRTFQVNLTNVLILLGLVLVMTFYIIPTSDGGCYNWLWGGIIGSVTYIVFSSLLRCMLNW